jgi:hypothetical protein
VSQARLPHSLAVQLPFPAPTGYFDLVITRGCDTRGIFGLARLPNHNYAPGITHCGKPKLYSIAALSLPISGNERPACHVSLCSQISVHGPVQRCQLHKANSGFEISRGSGARRPAQRYGSSKSLMSAALRAVLTLWLPLTKPTTIKQSRTSRKTTRYLNPNLTELSYSLMILQRIDVSPTKKQLLGGFTVICLVLNRTIGMLKSHMLNISSAQKFHSLSKATYGNRIE